MEERLIFEYLKKTEEQVFECIRIIKAKGLIHDLRFIDWEDRINTLSTLDHNKSLF